MPLLPTYKCSQQNLYTLCRLAWNTVTTYLAQFTAFSPMYLAALVTARLAEVDAAEALPDEEQRIEDSRVLRVNLVNKATEGRDFWQRLKRYILKAYPKDEQEIRLNAAGQAHYAKAGNDDWEAMKRLMNDGDAFIAANTAALTASSNMPPAFVATFNTSKTEYNDIYADYLAASQTDEVETQTKITANNELHTNVMSMMLDGQEIFKDDEAIKKLFTFDQVLLTVAGPGIAGARGLATNGATGQPMIETVTIQFTGPTNKTVTTDEDGRFNSSPMAEGSYIAIATAPNFNDLQITSFEIEAGVMKTLNITMTPTP